MEQALKIWDELGLPSVKLNDPWHGYNLGLWSKEEEEYAQLAARGDFYRIGEILREKRAPIEEVGLE